MQDLAPVGSCPAAHPLQFDIVGHPLKAPTGDGSTATNLALEALAVGAAPNLAAGRFLPRISKESKKDLYDSSQLTSSTCLLRGAMTYSQPSRVFVDRVTVVLNVLVDDQVPSLLMSRDLRMKNFDSTAQYALKSISPPHGAGIVRFLDGVEDSVLVIVICLERRVGGGDLVGGPLDSFFERGVFGLGIRAMG
ncbi:hypothetical protein SCAR479_10850 [Seiridium cardinale]|uniref:Uncharacterized protein n=1 Tax=Seiridium cardinale TaxID=138064 RepID=A0ABR2XFJ1_9PEZI